MGVGPELLGGQCEAQQALHLAGGDGQGGRRGEPGDHGDGNEVYQESKFEQTTYENDTAGEKCEEYCVLSTVLGVDACHQSHDGCWANSDVLGAAEDDVHEAAHERGVQSVLGLEARHNGVGDTLRYDGESHGDSGNKIRDGIVQTVAR